jgi:death on curing protein
MAAMYWFGLSKNHAFVDGNKRIAFRAMDVFLRINGFRLSCTPDEAADMGLEIA